MKAWLKRKRIYLEVAAPVLVGVAAIVISVLQYVVADAQLDVQHALLKPVMYVDEEMRFNEETRKYSTPTYVVKNAGAPAIRHDVDLDAYFEISWPDHSRKSINVPVVGFHPWSTRTAGVHGELARFVGVDDDNRVYAGIDRESVKFSKGKTSKLKITLNALVRIKFRDVLNQEHVVYSRGIEIIEESEGEALRESLLKQTPLEYKDLSFEQLLSRAGLL
jgi:hypothetical protein